MTEALSLAASWAAGAVLGAMFFGGLWWTVRKAVASEQPALWFLGSFMVRTSATLVSFYFIFGGRWERLLSGLLGFIMANRLVTTVVRRAGEAPSRSRTEVSHAPHA